MSRALGAGVMMLIGGACLRLVTSGRYLDYVKDAMLVPLLVSGVLLSALGVIGLVRAAYPVGAAVGHGHGGHGHGGHGHGGHGHGGHGHGGHGHGGHGHGEPRVAWLMLVPVLAIYLVPPPALGADSVARQAPRVAEPTVDFEPLPAGDPVGLTVREFAERAVYGSADELAERRVRLLGFVVPAEERDGAAPGTQARGTPEVAWSLARVSLFCCAADGAAYLVDVAGVGDDATALLPDTWVEVEGTFVPFSEAPDVRSVPVLAADEVRVVTPPENPYE